MDGSGCKLLVPGLTPPANYNSLQPTAIKPPKPPLLATASVMPVRLLDVILQLTAYTSIFL